MSFPLFHFYLSLSVYVSLAHTNVCNSSTDCISTPPLSPLNISAGLQSFQPVAGEVNNNSSVTTSIQHKDTFPHISLCLHLNAFSPQRRCPYLLYRAGQLPKPRRAFPFCAVDKNRGLLVPVEFYHLEGPADPNAPQHQPQHINAPHSSCCVSVCIYLCVCACLQGCIQRNMFSWPRRFLGSFENKGQMKTGSY